MVGCIVHFLYISVLFVYTYVVYIVGNNSVKEDGSEDNSLGILLLLGVIYPALYEFVQMLKVGVGEYLADFGNYVDLIYIWGSIAMSMIHQELGPFHLISKILMCIVVTLAIRRSFNILRIFKMLSPIVTMLSNVIWSLQYFMTFYLILVLLLSLMLGVLGVGNYKLDGAFRDAFWLNTDEDGNAVEPFLSPDAPGYEYLQVGMFFGNLFNIMRISMGDFPIIEIVEYTNSDIENYTFWFIWLITCIMTCIIFLNFIVAEAGNSYNEVSEQLENIVQMTRADMVAEAESLLPGCFKFESGYPKYIIIRKIET